MKTSLNEIREIDQYLSGNFDVTESLVFEARILVHEELRLHTRIQQKLLFLVKNFGRKKLKQEAEAIGMRIFSDPTKKDFQQKVSQLFNK